MVFVFTSYHRSLGKEMAKRYGVLHSYENVSYCQTPPTAVMKRTKSQFPKCWDRSEGQRSKTKKTGLRPMHADVCVWGDKSAKVSGSFPASKSGVKRK